MNVINMNDYNNALNFILKNGRKLEYYLLKSLMEKTYNVEIIAELKKYQNNDGGFGNALEPDLRLPDSSAVATEFAINIIEKFNTIDENLIIKIINYLESTYDKQNKIWKIIPEEANNYPRPIWFNYENIKQFGIFNPTATFSGFLYKYKNKVNSINIEELVNYIINEFINTDIKKIEQHSLFCIIRFYKYLPEKYQIRINDKINIAIENTIELDTKKWVEYSPEPIRYIDSTTHSLYKKYKKIIDANLDYLIQSKNEIGVWLPNHQWYQYEEVFKQTAYKEWIGIFTYENMERLIKFNRLK